MCRLVSVVLLLVCCTQSWAERAMLSGELGLWLQQSAMPELTSTLANHPKFKGEPIRLAAVNGGQAVGHSNALTEAIRQQLTHAVLRKGKNDVANNTDPGGCKKVPRPVYYLVGIEIGSVGHRTHRVSLAVLDIAESMWVGGISLTWQGRLLSSERDGLQTRVQHSAAGSVENPIALSDHPELAKNLFAQVRCRLPEGIDGVLSTVHPAPEELQWVLQDLYAQLALAALPVTDDEEDATWQLNADLKPVRGELQQLTLTLASIDRSSQQRLASLYVRGAAKTFAASSILLGNLAMHADRKSCRDGSCTEVNFNLHDAAYLLVFWTHQGSISPLRCNADMRKKAAGEQRYRLRLGGDHHQRIGFYVVASRHRGPLDALSRELRKAPGACGTPMQGDYQRWLRTTLANFAEQQHALQWRALHLTNTPRGPEAI